MAAILAIVAIVLFLTAGSLVGAIVGSVAIAVGGSLLLRPGGRSLVGNKCVVCGEGIYREADADLCAKGAGGRGTGGCGRAFHARCEKAHRAACP